MSGSETLQSGLNEFWTECTEIIERVYRHIEQINKGLTSPDLLDSIYRDIHTMKGSAQLFSIQNIAVVAHAMESWLEPVRSHPDLMTKELSAQLVESLDRLDEMVTSYRTNVHKYVELALETVGGHMPTTKESNEYTEDNAISATPSERSVPQAPKPVPTAAAGSGSAQINSADDSSSSDSSSTIRVPVGLLDRLMTLMGEMVLVRNQVLQFASKSDDLVFLNLSQRLDVVTSELQSEMMKTRMQPIGNILNKFQRLVRDLARDLNKKMELTLHGAETELDKTLLEAVKDPLTHIIRNACDHGMELPEDRRKQGKSEVGRISVKAFHEGGQVVIEITDDGKGLDREVLVNKALEKGLMTREKAQTLTEREVFGIIFMPGFSTAAKVTNISGRGVGMDVVRSNIDRIGGLVEIDSKKGQGTTIRLKIPLTLAIVPAMIVRCEEDRYAIPQVKLVELIRIDGSQSENRLEHLQGQTVLRLRGNLLPIVHLKDFLQFNQGSDGASRALDVSSVTNIVVLKAERQQFGVVVDEILDTADIVVKPLNRFLKSLNVYSGATVLGDGSVALILDVMGIAARMNISSDTHAAEETKDRAVANQSDLQEFLLFKLNQGGRHAIPLDLVHRLEEFKRDELEISGDTRVMRYRNSILPLISLNDFLNYEPVDGPPKDYLPVIVTQKSGKFYGVEVNEILDVLKTDANMDVSVADRPGLLGSFVANDQVIVGVDCLGVLSDVQKSLAHNQGLAIVEGEDPLTESVALSNQTILYAEDNAFFRKHVTAVLSGAGFRVTTANNGAEALAKLQESPLGTFDFVVSDIEMPVMTGLQFAQAVRQEARFAKLPMIALTTKFDNHHVKVGLDAGFTAYLEKLNPEQLLQTLKKMNKQKVA